MSSGSIEELELSDYDIDELSDYYDSPYRSDDEYIQAASTLR